MKLADMHKPEKNVRMHTENQLVEYERSVRMFGQTRPIIVDEDGLILVGNGLFDTLSRMGGGRRGCLCYERPLPVGKEEAHDCGQ